MAQMLSSFANDLKQALHGECTHESDGSFLLSDPPRTKCKKCGEFYFKALKPNNEVLRGQVVKKIEELVHKMNKNASCGVQLMVASKRSRGRMIKLTVFFLCFYVLACLGALMTGDYVMSCFSGFYAMVLQ